MQWIIGVYAFMSAVAFFAYGIDKRRARLGRWRTKESTLHLLEALGGFPGALAAQVVFRHKRRKWSFLLVTWAIAVVHVAAWLWWSIGGS